MRPDETMPALPAPGGERGGADADQHRATLNAATTVGEDTWAREERERREEERRRADASEEEQRYVAALDARSAALTAQARTDAMRSAGTVGVAGLAGLLLAGPIGAVAGVVGGWLFDKFNDPYGR